MKALLNVPTRVLHGEDYTTTDAQRNTQTGFQRTNLAIDAVNALRSTPYGDGQTLTQPDGTGGRIELLTLAAGANVIKHTLGRAVSGFAVVDLQAVNGRHETAGAFHDTTTQTAAAANTAYAMTFNSTDLSRGVSIGTPTSRLVVDAPGVYNVQFSAQLDRTAATDGLVWIWLRVNGVDVAASASQVRIKGNNAETVAAWNFMVTLAAKDYVQIMWAADDTASQIQYVAAAAPAPAVPSVIATVQAVSGGAQIYRVPQTSTEDAQTITLYAQVPCSAKIWVW